MFTRKTAITNITHRKGWGGTIADSYTHAQLFDTYGSADFGIMESQIFSSTVGDAQINTPWVYLTEAQGAIYELGGGVNSYCWKLSTPIIADAYVTRVSPSLSATPGKDGMEFEIYLDKGWFHEPVLLKTVSEDAPRIQIIGHPVQISADEFKYTCRVQSGSATSFIPASDLQVGQRMVDGGTAVADELNEKFGGDYTADVFELKSINSYYARKFEVTDKFVRMEIQSGKGKDNSGYSRSFGDGKAYSTGYSYMPGLATKGNGSEKMLKAGSMITTMEARLAERLYQDKNYSMEFGQTQRGFDNETNRELTIAPGWRQIRKDGHYQEHNGSLTLFDMYTDLVDIFNGKVGVGAPRIVLRTGKGGIEWFSRMVNAEAGANPFVLQDSYFVDKVDSKIHPKSLGFGAQFVEIRMPNGLTITVMYDPSKDNPQYYWDKVPGTPYTYESFTFDVIDLGNVDGVPAEARRRSNIAMVKEPMAETYFNVGNVYDLRTGATQNGSKVASTDKMSGVYREMNGALAVWDTSRIATWKYAKG